jgi:hypothetical protein
MAKSPVSRVGPPVAITLGQEGQGMATQRAKQIPVVTMSTVAFVSLVRMYRTKIVPQRGHSAARGA